MANINVNLKGFSPQVYDAWKNGAYSWHGGLKTGTPFITVNEVDIELEDDNQIMLKF